MGLVSKGHGEDAGRWLGVALAAGVPLIGYLLTASAHGYWLDAGEFVAASVNLGIAHPPGHPLAAIVGRLFAMLPLGPISLRVALACSAMAACAAAALYCAVETTVTAMGERRRWVAVPLAVGATWCAAGSYGWWFQAVRPEVYALQAALICLAIERAVALEAAWPSKDARPLITAALALGLGLANHHFMALLALPALVPITLRVFGSRGVRPIAIGCAAALLGLSVYLFLPLRAAAGPLPNLGEPTSWSRILWVVSAQTFQKNVGSGAPQIMSERYADVVAMLWNDLSICLFFALGGAYLMLRTAGARRIGVVWIALLGVNAIARAWLGFVRSNPDAAGYLLPCYAAVAALFAAFAAALISPQGNGPGAGAPGPAAPGRSPVLALNLLFPPAQRRAAAALAVALLAFALGLTQIYYTAARASLARFSARDDFDDLGRRELPPRAVVLAHDPGTVFSHWGGEGEDCLRPDLTLVPIPFLSYPGMVDRLIKERPELADLLREHLLHGELRQEALQSLAARQPLLLEMDVRVPPAIYQTVAPAGFFYQVLAGGTTRVDERDAARDQRELYRRLYRRLGPRRPDHATRARLVWRHFTDALYYMGYGDRDSARVAVRMARMIEPEDQVLRGLQEALADEKQSGPIDVAPFIELLNK